jgi:hypothetical protein
VEAREDHLAWLRRARWRLRGAWLAPAFVLFTLADTLILRRIPFTGDAPPGLMAAFLLAAFLNLLLVAVAAPLLGLWLRRRDRTLPPFAARDRAGVAVLAVAGALLVAGGLLHRGSVQDERAKLEAQAAAAAGWFRRQAPEAWRSGRDGMTTWKPGPDFYRTCIPAPRTGRALCVFVSTDQSPPGVTRDASQEPNEQLAGPLAEVQRIRPRLVGSGP